MLQSVIVYIIIFLALVGAVYFIYRRFRAFRKDSSCSGCRECPLKNNCRKMIDERKNCCSSCGHG